MMNLKYSMKVIEREDENFPPQLRDLEKVPQKLFVMRECRYFK